jgi:hypothetical protein
VVAGLSHRLTSGGKADPSTLLTSEAKPFWTLDLALLWLLRVLTIIADGFYGTTSEGFFAGGLFFWGLRLFVDKRITIFVGSPKTLGRRVATDIAVDTRGVDIISAGNILFNFVVWIWQYFGLGFLVLGLCICILT